MNENNTLTKPEPAFTVDEARLIQLCIEFANATDLTLHYNLVTHESSIYFIKD